VQLAVPIAVSISTARTDAGGLDLYVVELSMSGWFFPTRSFRADGFPFPGAVVQTFGDLVLVDFLHGETRVLVAYCESTRVEVHREAFPCVDLRGWPLWRWRMLSKRVLERAAAKRSQELAEYAVSDEAFASKYPNLFVCLAANTGPDGAPRSKCKVTVFCDGGSFKASLIDPEGEQSLFVTLKTPQGVWDALEKSLSAEEQDWRAWRYNGAQEKSPRGLPRAKK
jgi:hypothetical protein